MLKSEQKEKEWTKASKMETEIRLLSNTKKNENERRKRKVLEKIRTEQWPLKGTFYHIFKASSFFKIHFRDVLLFSAAAR